MKFQIARARQYFADAEAGVDHLDTDARWPVWSALILYRYCSRAFCMCVFCTSEIAMARGCAKGDVPVCLSKSRTAAC